MSTSSGSLQTFLRRCKYCLLLILVLSVFVFVIYLKFNVHNAKQLDTIQSRDEKTNIDARFKSNSINIPLNNCTLGSKVLIFAHSQSDPVLILLQALRIEYHIENRVSHLLLPPVSDRQATHYYAIIFTDITDYELLTTNDVLTLNNYCKSIKCSIIIFTHTDPTSHHHTTDRRHVYSISKLFQMLHSNSEWSIDGLNSVKYSNIYSFAKPDISVADTHQIHNFTCLRNRKPSLKSFLIGKIKHKSGFIETGCSFVVFHNSNNLYSFYFGIDANYWLIKLILLDIIKFISPISIVRRNLYPVRYIQVDIDDIFIAKPELKMRSDDVRNLVSSQMHIRNIIPRFKYNLGYCGAYFQSGPEEVKIADQLLIDNSNEFTWFGHLWDHSQPHKLTYTNLVDSMKQDINFSDQHNLSIKFMQYTVTPHHSGVYPIHNPLYDAWNKFNQVSVTSTQQYPNLHPFYLRRGFIYKGIKILPRYNCGLFTKTNRYSEYTGGKEALLLSTNGGKVFSTILYSPVSIFMTHLSNYALDRLAPTLFENLVLFITQYTNIKLMYTYPFQLADIHFRIYPEDTQILWSKESFTSELKLDQGNDPRFIIVGPQKTGSTALQFFLSHLPELSTSKPDVTSFEETHFFSNSTRYQFGVDWYLNKFTPHNNNNNNQINNSSSSSSSNSSSRYVIFEKSAGYFDNRIVPQRIHSLFPSVNIIIILQDPIRRAYSWYQHMRTHNDVTAIHYSFDEVLNISDDKPHHIEDYNFLVQLRNKCLRPGRYVENIREWLYYFKLQQLYFVDGSELTNNPIISINKLLRYLSLTTSININNSIVYREKKGYYCLNTEHNKQCLGSSKGRTYPPMTTTANKYLSNYYKEYNVHLIKFLTVNKRPLPDWLRSNL